ncbi:LacI family DNA-binding transcriptional regulator [Clostridium akagii]|uniref:LacI family DNA-binding transcriptional regulator n=1 Tax=Clostridium akagii TaxID=91623 RepID=UPI000ADB816D|nr:LacI family DNA-binding transcriptional regulator [Clostridium akagii]
MSDIYGKINSAKIAKLAGVSRSTVSKVINNYDDVSKQTYEKVMKIIKQYNYYPDISAQGLKGKETKTIGLFIISPEGFSNDAHCNFMLGRVVESASIKGYHVLTYIINDTKDELEAGRIKRVFYEKRVNGGIFIGTKNHEPLVEELIGDGFIVGVMDGNLKGRKEANRLVINFESKDNAIEAVDYLISLNHKKIGFINGSLDKNSGLEKYKGFTEGIKKNNLDIPDEWVTFGDFSENGGYVAMEKILESKRENPTAICSANDSTAFGAIKAITEKGLNIPKDISIIGSDDHILSAYYNPPLTTFRVDFTEIMTLLVTNLIKLIEGNVEEMIIIPKLNTEFIIRKSCRKLEVAINK